MRARRADAVWLAVLLGLCAWAIVSPPIWTRGEAREALVVRDIVRNGHWVIGWRDGVLASKPPLFHWIAAVAAELFGVHTWIVRLPSALGALAMLIATYSLGKRMGGRALGTLGATILAAMPLFWRFACEGRVDMVFAAAIATALLAFYVRDGDATRGSLAFVVATAAAVLTKGPAGLVLPLGIMTLFLVIERQPRELVTRWAAPAAAAAAIALVWYAAASAIVGRHFVDVQLLHENVARLVGDSEDFERLKGRELNLPGAFAGTLLPWNLVLLWSLWRRIQGAREDRAGHLLHAWWIVTFGFFAIAPRTRTVYLLPLYPAVALLAARALLPVATRRIRTAIAAFGVVILVGTQIARLHEFRHDPLPGFATRIAPRVADTNLRAAPLLRENDALVLRWHLDHSITRGPLECRPDTLVLAAAASLEKAAGLGLTVVERAGTGDREVALLECRR
jgi:4-amino-4-deoxy-L-arabinose transferase-like glycosyltransferase